MENKQMEILLASNNKNKHKELLKIFQEFGSKHTLIVNEEIPDVIEDKNTIEENAKKYAAQKKEFYYLDGCREDIFWGNGSLILELIKEIQPDIVVNTVAHSSVDLCESDHKIADKLHVDITQDITQVCKDVDSKLVYISTDAVFQGELHKKYTELDQPNPINYYGKTKLQAEQITLNASSKNVVLRTAVIYGWHKKSRFTNWIIQRMYICSKKVYNYYSEPTESSYPPISN